MRLADVAVAFDKMPCVDAYTGRLAFVGQLSNYDDTKRDSEAAERRVISTHPDVTIPPRRVIQAAGPRFIIGHGNPDNYRGRNIRIGWVAHEATQLAHIQTLAQACLGQTGLKAWSGMAWVKNLTDETENSRLLPQCNLHFALAEPLAEARLVTMPSGHIYLVRNVREGPAGTKICLSDNLPSNSLQTATLSAGTFNRVTETWSGSTDPVKVLRTRWQSLFTYEHSAAPRFGPGDLQIVIAKASLTPVVGQDITMVDGKWRIESVADEGDIWICRGCSHG